MSKPIKENWPKISIIIPSFNKKRFIEQTFKSIIQQKYPNLEVLIYDGKSTDGTTAVIQSYCQKYPQIFKWVSKKDQGQLDAINRGMKKANGKILTYLNADDIYYPNTLHLVAQTFRQNPQTIWVTGFGNIINDKNKTIALPVTRYKNTLIKINRFFFLLMVNYITQPATFLNKEAYKKYGPFKGTKQYVMEYDLWLKLGRVKMPVVLNQTLASFRLTTDAISLSSFSELLKLDQQIVEKYTDNKSLLFMHSLNNLVRQNIGFFLTKKIMKNN